MKGYKEAQEHYDNMEAPSDEDEELEEEEEDFDEPDEQDFDDSELDYMFDPF